MKYQEVKQIKELLKEIYKIVLTDYKKSQNQDNEYQAIVDNTNI